MILQFDIIYIGVQYQAFEELKCTKSRSYIFGPGRKGAESGF